MTRALLIIPGVYGGGGVEEGELGTSTGEVGERGVREGRPLRLR